MNMKNKKTGTICDWTEKKPVRRKAVKKNDRNVSALYRHSGNYTWKGVRTEKYKESGEEWARILRRTIIGNHGESVKFHVRYFEIAPGGYSSLERHRHEHVIIGIRGKGICVIGKKRRILRFLDTLYIDPGTPHQLKNMSNEPFGFLCIVHAKRDRPTLLE